MDRKTDFDRAFDRLLEKEPTYAQRRQRIPLVERGAVKTWWEQRQQIAKVVK